MGTRLILRLKHVMLKVIIIVQNNYIVWLWTVCSVAVYQLEKNFGKEDVIRWKVVRNSNSLFGLNAF